MKAIKALYEDGRVFFPFHEPQYEGPVAVLVIFPETEKSEPEEEESTQAEASSPAVPSKDPPSDLLRVPKIPWPGDCLRKNSPL